MGIKREFLGETAEGAPVYGYHLTNTAGMEVCVMNYGAVIRNIIVPDKNGVKRDVALGFDTLEEYFINRGSVGATVGPVANRTAGAKYTIDGTTYHMIANEGANNLHTDPDHCFYKRVWETEETDHDVTFLLDAPDGDLGFPGNRHVSLTFSLSEENELRLHYHVTSDAKTYLNLTNHAYFNLGGHDSGKVLQHVMQLNASHYTPVVKGAIPTGEIASVSGTPLDFSKPKTIGQDIDADFEQLKLVGGYDHNFCIDGADGTLRGFANVTNPVTGITMHCATTLPGFQFYSANGFHSDHGKDGVIYDERDGFCLETQFYPNSVNEPAFPDVIFGPDRAYDSVTVYQFT
jgi:aldose 1-epimerase